MYFPHNKNKILLLIESVIINQDASFFKNPIYKEKNVCIYMKNFSLKLLNILQGFIHFINIFVVTTQIVSMHLLFEYDPHIYKSVKGIGLIILLEFRLLLLDITLYLFAHSHILLACMWTISLKIFTIKLDLLKRPPSQRQLGSISYYLDNFRVEFTKTLLLIIDANQMFSVIMALFLLVNCPLNCLLVCLLILGKIPAQKVTFVGPVSIERFVFLMFLHFRIASVNKRIHAPSKQFIRLSLYNKYCKIKYRIKLDNFIHSIHTRKKMGFTYYSVGLISMMAFTRYLILYSELVMFLLKFESGKNHH